jgi:hypothetical protein
VSLESNIFRGTAIRLSNKGCGLFAVMAAFDNAPSCIERTIEQLLSSRVPCSRSTSLDRIVSPCGFTLQLSASGRTSGAQTSIDRAGWGMTWILDHS